MRFPHISYVHLSGIAIYRAEFIQIPDFLQVIYSESKQIMSAEPSPLHDSGYQVYSMASAVTIIIDHASVQTTHVTCTIIPNLN
jgi:hypothetical protein